MKRQLGKFTNITPRSTILIYIPCDMIIEGITLVRLLSKIERKYQGKIIVVLPDKVNNGLLPNHIETIYTKYSSNEIQKCNTIVEYFMNQVNKALHYGKEANVKYVVLPYTLTDLNLFVLTSIIIDNKIPKDLGKLRWQINNVTAVIPLHRVSKLDVMAYAYSTKILRLIPQPICQRQCGVYNAIKEWILEIDSKHSELSYSLMKSLKVFTSLERGNLPSSLKNVPET